MIKRMGCKDAAMVMVRFIAEIVIMVIRVAGWVANVGLVLSSINTRKLVSTIDLVGPVSRWLWRTTMRDFYHIFYEVLPKRLREGSPMAVALVVWTIHDAVVLVTTWDLVEVAASMWVVKTIYWAWEDRAKIVKLYHRFGKRPQRRAAYQVIVWSAKEWARWLTDRPSFLDRMEDPGLIEAVRSMI